MARIQLALLGLFLLAYCHFQEVLSASPPRNYPSGFRESMDDPGMSPSHGFYKRPQSYRTYYPRRTRRSPTFSKEASGGFTIGGGASNSNTQQAQDGNNDDSGNFSFHVQKIVESVQGMGNSVSDMFQSMATAVGRSVTNCVKNFNNGMQSFTKTVNDLFDSKTSRNQQSSEPKNNNGPSQWQYQVSWKSGKSLGDAIQSFNQN